MCSMTCPCRKRESACNDECKCKGRCNVPAPAEIIDDIKCSCGRNPNSAVESCSESKKKIRCKCLISGRPCSEKCNCLKCCNPNGANTSEPISKKRARRDNQVKYTKNKTKVHLTNIGSSLPAGPWNNDETLLLIVLMKQNISDDLIFTMYSDYFEHNCKSKKLDMQLKSKASVNAKLKSMRNKEVFP